MRTQMIISLQNFLLAENDEIELSNFKFTHDIELHRNFFDKVTKESIGLVNCTFVRGVGIIYFDQPIDFAPSPISVELQRKAQQSADHKADMLESFINILWLVKDNAVSTEYWAAKLTDTPYAAFGEPSPTCSLADGSCNYVPFTRDDLEDGHSLWVKLRSLVPEPHTYDKETTTLYTVEDVITKTRSKSHHREFQYQETNCLGRSLEFLKTARRQDYLVYKIAYYIPILECLFSTEQIDITTKIAYRTAFYVGNTTEERREIERIVRKAYNIRSRFIHGQIVKEGTKEKETFLYYAKNLDSIIRVALRKVIEKDSTIFLNEDGTDNKNREDFLISLVFQ